ncbi:MAG: SIMPL domain-containing protein [Anaerolineales bacterium]|nr:SIMPL domain-containing protein [Anaerolineales bacterium]
MKNKFWIFAALALMLALSACGPTTINQAAQPIVRTLNVTGVGQTYLTPDIAYIYIGVHTESPTAADAVSANTAKTVAVTDAIKKAGVAAKDIVTTNFSIYPSQQYNPDGVVGASVYMVDNTVYVTVRKLDGLGKLLDDVVNAGANNINSIQFDVADRSAAVKEARTKAVDDAKKQAQELADAAGISLGDIQNINFYDSSPYPAPMYGKGGGGAMDASAAAPIQPGQLAVSVNVSITYSIK